MAHALSALACPGNGPLCSVLYTLAQQEKRKQKITPFSVDSTGRLETYQAAGTATHVAMLNMPRAALA